MIKVRLSHAARFSMKRLPRALLIFLFVSVGVSFVLGAIALTSPIGDRFVTAWQRLGALLHPSRQEALSLAAPIGWLFLIIGGMASSVISATSFNNTHRILAGNGIALGLLFIALGSLWLFGAPILAVGGIVAALFPPLLRYAFDFTAPGRRLSAVQKLLADRTSANEFSRILSQSASLFTAEEERSVFILCVRSGGAELAIPNEAESLAAQLGQRYQQAITKIFLNSGGYLLSQDPHVSLYAFGLFETNNNMGALAAKVDAALEGSRKGLGELQRLQAAEHKWDQLLGIASVQGKLPSLKPDETASRSDLELDRPAIPGHLIDEALRLSRLSLNSRTYPLASSNVYTALSDEIAFRPLDLIYDNENNLLNECYHWVGRKASLSEVQQSRLDLYWKAVLHFRAGKWREAQDAFSRSTLGSDDPAVRYFQSRISERTKETETNPFSQSNSHNRLLPELD